MGPNRIATEDAAKEPKSSEDYIDIPAATGKLLATDAVACGPGMEFSLRISAPSFVRGDGDSRYMG
ncbi:hypothetical protein LBMAG41_04010 [Cyanobium sp.]|nr:hypothetical protein LBMAG41_04010 [Cyanobium sp.]